MSLRINNNILNQKGTPAFFSDIFANRPAFGFAGRVFISTDTGQIFEDTGTAWTLLADAGAGTTGTLQQVTTNGNSTTQGLVVTAGNVAIGTATAGAPLDIHCTGTAAQFNGTGTNNAFIFFQNAGANKWRFGNNYNANANSLDFFNSGLAAVVASFNANGSLLLNANLGIKYNTGFNQVSGYANIAADSGGFFFNNGGANNAYLNLTALTGSRTFTLPDATGTLALTSNLSSYVPTSRTLTINGVTFDLSADRSWTVSGSSQWTTSGSNIYYNTGNVLIGTTTDTGYKLQVQGDFQINGSGSIFVIQARNLGGYFGFYANDFSNFNVFSSSVGILGQFANTTGIYTPLSDINKKQDFEDSTIGLNAILGLKPTLYRMKNQNNTEKHLGFIAQQVKEFIPQAYVENKDFIGLNYNSIVATLVKAIQELNEKLERNNIN